MKATSSALTLCGLSLLFLGGCHSKTAPSSSAEQNPSPSAGTNAGGFVSQAQAREDRMKQELALTDDQIQKIHAIMEDNRPAMEALRSDDSLTQEQRTAKFQELRDAMRTKLQAILTPDQLAKWEEMRKNQGGGHWHHRDGGGDQTQQQGQGQSQ